VKHSKKSGIYAGDKYMNEINKLNYFEFRCINKLIGGLTEREKQTVENQLSKATIRRDYTPYYVSVYFDFYENPDVERLPPSIEIRMNGYDSHGSAITMFLHISKDGLIKEFEVCNNMLTELCFHMDIDSFV
jgi:hypothetical protein